MTIEPRTLHILEYAKIRERLAQHTSFSASRQLALQLQPDDDIDAIRRAQRATSAARQLFDTYPDVTIGGSRDVIACGDLSRVPTRVGTRARVR